MPAILSQCLAIGPAGRALDRIEGAAGITGAMFSRIAGPNSFRLAISATLPRNIYSESVAVKICWPDPDAWLALREVFAERTANARNAVAITRTDVVDIADLPISQLMNGRRREDEIVRAPPFGHPNYEFMPWVNPWLNRAVKV